MDRDIKKLLIISLIILLFGGFGALTNLWSGIIQILLAFFPIFGPKIVEDYFTSPYFIVSVIMAIGSCFGIWFGKRGGKVLYTVVSIILLILNLVSIGLNTF